jgi:hypothetical protein
MTTIRDSRAAMEVFTSEAKRQGLYIDTPLQKQHHSYYKKFIKPMNNR